MVHQGGASGWGINSGGVFLGFLRFWGGIRVVHQGGASGLVCSQCCSIAASSSCLLLRSFPRGITRVRVRQLGPAGHCKIEGARVVWTDGLLSATERFALAICSLNSTVMMCWEVDVPYLSCFFHSVSCSTRSLQLFLWCTMWLLEFGAVALGCHAPGGGRGL